MNIPQGSTLTGARLLARLNRDRATPWNALQLQHVTPAGRVHILKQIPGTSTDRLKPGRYEGVYVKPRMGV